MPLSTLITELFGGTESKTNAPVPATENDETSKSVTVVHECRDCGTNVSAGTAQCPTCEGDDLVTYSID
ncbi:hypothetical protein [Natrinema halophilum]|uniref:hypothetical protein n=1 Tax=Natrinema halophilum TaxID=1699371 RepID=UPI001F2313AD|nr:hypothetical protein [Natrinema halophilum]UHQ96070.1 hypothetical protein HYG82_20965 [Natrinema halophilum]